MQLKNQIRVIQAIESISTLSFTIQYVWFSHVWLYRNIRGEFKFKMSISNIWSEDFVRIPSVFGAVNLFVKLGMIINSIDCKCVPEICISQTIVMTNYLSPKYMDRNPSMHAAWKSSECSNYSVSVYAHCLKFLFFLNINYILKQLNFSLIRNL